MSNQKLSNKDILLEIQKEIIEIKKDLFVIKSLIVTILDKKNTEVSSASVIPEDKSSEGWLLWSSK